MENKQHATLQPLGHQRKQKENFKNSWNKWKWKHNCLAKAVLRGKFTVR